jgi:hypothetical protein
MGVTTSHALEKRLKWLARLQGSYTINEYIYIKKTARVGPRARGRRVVDRHKYFVAINYSIALDFMPLFNWARLQRHFQSNELNGSGLDA